MEEPTATRSGDARQVLDRGEMSGTVSAEVHDAIAGNGCQGPPRGESSAQRPRPARRWEPVVISPVFPRGPLALPSLASFTTDCAPERRPAADRCDERRRRISCDAAVHQNLSRAACSSA